MEELENEEALESTLMELAATRKVIEQARKNTIPSRLKSAPLIGKLEEQQSMLAKNRKQVAMATSVIASLGSLLETTTKSAESKEDDDCKNMIVIEETMQAKERHQQELEKLVAEIEVEKGEGRKLKEKLHMRRQSLRTLQLKMRAASMGIEAFNSSLGHSLDQLNHLKVEIETVTLSHKDLCSLQREVDKDTTLANWRVVAVEKERHAAELNKEKALKRLEELYKEKKLKESTTASTTNEMENNEAVEQFRRKQVEAATRARASPQHQNQFVIGSQILKRGVKGRRNNKRSKYKPNILQKMLKFLCISLR